ncbi:MAG: hypothetical protein CL866_02890 [Cycloclasticus sp.]|nr:hypothetical protein [Cycloclasticus sp.]MBG95802.1 hypothetical protein [Cycloclasticus sp.]HAI96059.1 hypothetical protein [Methylococcaceae bacterium]|tara:strand:- start:1001 stop:3262 length:2262 start_codon:yes stop_codon:yes gene_type:complete
MTLTPNKNSNLNHALKYASIGWQVFPLHYINAGKCSCGKQCKSPGKHPILGGGFKAATLRKDIIKKWWKQHPNANIGVRTGKESGIFVLDIDPKNDGEASFDKIQEVYGKVPDDVFAVTGSGGRHYIFKHPGDIGRSTTNLWPGIDTRGDGGYIVVAPSNHISGKEYFWDAEADPLNGAHPKAAPDWLIKKLGQGKNLAKPPENIILLPVDEVKRIRHAIAYIPTDDRDTWLQVGMALHSTESGDQAYGLWNEWAGQSDKFDLADQRRVWDSFKPGGVTLGSLFALAKNNGWIPPTQSNTNEPPIEAYITDQTANNHSPALTEVDSELLNPPPELDPIALHGILKEACEVSTRFSEASKVAVAANILSTFSAIVGRTAYQHIGDGICHARPYFLLTGKTGKARKGTSEYTPKRLFDAVETMLGDDYTPAKRHEGGLSTGEGLGWTIRDDTLDEDGEVTEAGVKDKRLYISEAEFAGTMAAASREKNNLSATIRTAWDGKTISPLVKNAKWCTTNPHIVITGHITSAELLDRMSDVDAQSGFMNRFVILHIVRPKLVPLPKRTPDADVQRIAAHFAEAVIFARGNDEQAKNGLEVKLSPEAIKYWCVRYKALTKEENGLAGVLLVRTEVYCRMFAMIFALLDKSATIEVAHIKAALGWIKYWRDSVRYIFQTLAAKAEASKMNETAKSVYEFISSNPKCTRTELTSHFKNKLNSSEITQGLNYLMNAAPPLIKQEMKPRADGKPGKGTMIFWKP